MKPKIYIGPMSKNIVDSIIEFCDETDNKIGLIPSRRQVDWDGGYVNNWTTQTFSEYSNKLFLVRDHSGPEQGHYSDDGHDSLLFDCKYLNMIHIDPWKKYPEYKKGLETTIAMIKFCHQHNPNIEFEVGTEESIRKFELNELNQFLSELYVNLTESEYNQIKYVVIQSGTSLKENTNTGKYDKKRLISMIEIAKEYNLLTKEHNGDYLPTDLIKEKFDLGLDAINIAPEFGQIETKVYLDRIKNNHPDLLDTFWEICYNSRRWEKWISKDFDPLTQKEELINICGHYVLSHPDFLDKIKYVLNHQIDIEIKTKIKEKLYEKCSILGRSKK